jgi:hypothetical protein
MREKAQARMGRKFEMLLGTEHRYGTVDDACFCALRLRRR